MKTSRNKVGSAAAAVCVAVAIILLAFGGEASGLDPNRGLSEYSYNGWNIEDGLPQNSVQAIVQTRDGYLWLGTQEGLARFDGINFTVLDKSNSAALKNNSIQALLEDADGSLWVGTSGGGLSRLQNGRLATYTLREGLSNDTVRTLYRDQAGTIWIGTDGGLTRFKDNRFTTYTIHDGLLSDVVLAVCEDRAGNLWVGTDKGLNLFRDGKFSRYALSDDSSETAVYAIYEDRAGSLWIGTYGGGLHRLKDGRLITYTTRDGLTSDMVRVIYQDRAGNLWVGTTGGGLNRFEHEGFTHFTTKEGLSNDLVIAVHQDREGSLWIGTHGGGLSRLKDGGLTAFTTRDGLPHEQARAILQDKAGTIWIGTDGGGLTRIRDGQLTVYTTRDGLSSNMVRAIYEDRAGTIWIGTYGGGVNRLRDNRFTHYTTKNGLSNDLVRAIYEDRAGSLWIGTYGGGVNRIKDGKVTVFTTQDGLANNMVFSITEDHDGNLWISTRGGLSRFKDNRFRSYTTRDGLSSDMVFFVYVDQEGSLWVGTSGGGFNRLKNGKFTIFTMKDGLFDDLVYRVLEDSAGNFWMSCNKGIFSISKQQLNDFADGKRRSITSTAYAKADGMPSSECNGGSDPAGWRTTDGRLWFPTLKGIAIIDPGKIKHNELPPAVKIERVLVDDKTLEFTEQIALRPGTDKLEFHYTGLSFLAPQKVRFKYKLEGFDHGWIDAGTRRTAYYTNIPPGRYRFRVIACNNDGVWNETGASFDFHLKPYLYQTIWFYLLCALVVALAAAGGYRLRMSQLRRRENELVTLVEERTQQLTEANQQLHRLSYVDGLTGVANRRYFDELIGGEWRRAARARTPLSLIMIDIDFFKNFNDTYGHQQGDETLRRVAERLKSSLARAGDVVARYGGEEFAVLLPKTDEGGVVAMAAKLRASIEELLIPHESSQCSQVVTISVGCATTIRPADDDSFGELIRAADQALYEAKRRGRNCFIISEPVSLLALV